MIPDNALDMVRALHALGATEIVLGELRVTFPARPVEITPERVPNTGRQLTDHEAFILAATASS